jgi:hypothetical protein
MGSVVGFRYKSWIPISNAVAHGTGGNGQFDIFQENYVNLVTANSGPWNVDSGRLAILTGFQASYAASYAIWKDPNNRTHANVIQYNSDFKAYVKQLRIFNRANIKYNPALTSGDLASLGVNTNDLHTQATPMINMPWGTQLVVTPLGSGAVKFVFRNFNPSDPLVISKGKARGVNNFQVNYNLGGAPPTAPSDAILRFNFTRAINVVQLPASAVGQNLYCFATSVGRTGLQGTFTAITSTVVA